MLFLMPIQKIAITSQVELLINSVALTSHHFFIMTDRTRGLVGPDWPAWSHRTHYTTNLFQLSHIINPLWPTSYTIHLSTHFDAFTMDNQPLGFSYLLKFNLTDRHALKWHTTPSFDIHTCPLILKRQNTLTVPLQYTNFSTCRCCFDDCLCGSNVWYNNISAFLSPPNFVGIPSTFSVALSNNSHSCSMTMNVSSLRYLVRFSSISSRSREYPELDWNIHSTIQSF